MTEVLSDSKKYFEFVPCSWDAQAIGLPVYRIAISSDFNPDSLREAAGNLGRCLIYIFLDYRESEYSDLFQKYGAILADEKVTYQIDTGTRLLKSTDLREGNIEDYERTLPLAFEAGHYSRFRADNRMPSSVYQYIYSEWLRKSLCRKFDDIVFIKDGTIAVEGLVSVRFLEDFAQVGLISVHPESRGKGLGKRLLDHAIAEASSNGFGYLRVATQLTNKPANRFYEFCGFKKHIHQKVLHWWID